MFKWYSVEIPYNTREYIKRVCSFKQQLVDNCIKFEPSAAGEKVHFEIYLDDNGVKTVNEMLDKTVFYDAITEVQKCSKVTKSTT